VLELERTEAKCSPASSVFDSVSSLFVMASKVVSQEIVSNDTIIILPDVRKYFSLVRGPMRAKFADTDENTAANIQFRVPYSQRYLVLRLVGLVRVSRVGRVSRVRVILTVTVRVSRVSIIFIFINHNW